MALQSLRHHLGNLFHRSIGSTSLNSAIRIQSQQNFSTTHSGPLMARCRTFPGWGPSPYHRTPYLSIYDITNNCKRKSFRAAVERFKRLDWGIFIRPRGGRNYKHWKRSLTKNYELEQHIFTTKFHTRRLNRMFGPEVKAIRHIPDDPYYKYNNLVNFAKHRYTKMKNLENIRLHGNKKHLINPFKFHYSTHYSKYNKLETYRYEPPGYVANVSANKGVFMPEFIPEDTPAPHFQRPLFRHNKHLVDRHVQDVKTNEMFYGRLEPWHPLLKSKYKRF